MTNIFVTFYPNICPELVCVAAKTKKEYAEKMTKNGLKKDFCKQLDALVHPRARNSGGLG